MKKRKIELAIPENPPKKKSLQSGKSFYSTIVKSRAKNVYSAVKKFRTDIFPKLTNQDLKKDQPGFDGPLGRIINLHNATEIRQRSTSVSEMQEKIESGKHILMPDGLPNVKVVKSRKGRWVCFDGHHSLLAYMLARMNYLQEVPHLVITDASGNGLSDEEIHTFFGDYANYLGSQDWRNYTISWTKPPDQRLEKRKQKDMSELLSALSKIWSRI